MSRCSLWASAVGAMLMLAGPCAAAQPQPDAVRPALLDSTSAAPSAAPTLRLDSLLAAAARGNPSLQAARLKTEARAERGAQTGALPDPTVGATAFPVPLVTARGEQRTQWRVQQAIPFPGKRTLRREVADLGADVARADAQALEQTLALRIRRAYYTLVRVRSHEHSIRRFQADLEQFERAAIAQYEVGEEGQSAVLKAQIERQRLQTRLEGLASERQSALQTLARLTGRAALAERDTQVAIPSRPDLPSTAPDEALDRRPEAEKLRRRIQQSEREAELAKTEQWPDFTVGAQYFDIAASDLGPTMTGRDALALSVGVTVPLWRGKQEANIQEARIERRRAETQLEGLRLEVRTRLADLQQQIERHRRQLTLLDETLLPKAETALETSLSGYRTGQNDFLDLLDAERTLFQLRLQRASVFARLLTTQAEWERTAGRVGLADGGE
ncbi:TolC family protein [Salinibacter sp.]|uniref:TolC family protein n=1 Tax=Salinibacter sp. TaxID=2065818 RepID=UPI0021E7EF6D|nr:TolC family protein [Salinibacter sp.]